MAPNVGKISRYQNFPSGSIFNLKFGLPINQTALKVNRLSCREISSEVGKIRTSFLPMKRDSATNTCRPICKNKSVWGGTTNSIA